ncbi:TetR family transcriptional regulator [Solirubrobacter sp. CPCC 204708]|uniref:TetR family transcriptional regulator n=1 Tax=Solirubrobacter deserti TaxID=2282478 RepID=A0ABT4RCI8_9ACTN|nr:TetR family transcriptional regulator [Solirubrobacter deserti]MBE2315602.1 TetR family transcriptional regulator [Solirubrobacter deserti]MDA0136241.1 TetR family transcriptional regulator [Solirubrobacter deserti]
MPATRAEASQRVRDAIVAATVRIVAREGVAAVTHRRVAAEAGVALSSTTWHYATKADILEAALVWTAEHEVASIAAIADRLTGFDVAAWADELADWLLAQLGEERELTVALYRLQAELLGSEGALAVHRQWGRGLRALGDRVLGEAATVDVRLVIAALDGLRMSALASGVADRDWVRAAVRRQLEALLA